MNKTSELLSVLKLNEQGQAKWMYNYGVLPQDLMAVGADFAIYNEHRGDYCFSIYIYELAFTLRDMAVKKDEQLYCNAMRVIDNFIYGGDMKRFFAEDYSRWFLTVPPIRIIVASLLVLDCEDFKGE